jgi:uncharacterized membrane protein
MAETQTFFVAASFSDEGMAGGMLQTLLKAKQERNLGVLEAAVIRKEDDGRIDIKEEGELGAAGGAVAGGLLGSIVGILRGSPIAGTGLGAVLGGVAAKAFDSGIPDARLNDIAKNLPNGSSAVVAVVTESALAETRTLLQGGSVAVEPITLAPPKIDVPDTGNKTIDEWADKAAATVAGYAGQAEKALSGLAGRAQEAYQGAAGAAKNEGGEAGGSENPATPPAPVQNP